MSPSLIERRIACPYCGEALDILVDASPGSHHYIEDCQVCCRPIEITVEADAGELQGLQVGRDS